VLERVLKTISRYNMLGPGARVAVAVSGGADSVCLLHVLIALGVMPAGVVHFNHKLRGAASDEDESFVASKAASIGLAFYRAEAEVGAVNDNLEQAARRARRQFFTGLIRDGAADRIALGHTRDDQAETVLFRLLRGSGLAGLAGIHPVTAEGLIRPLIDVSHAEVEAFLRERDIAWREDATNRDPRFARNRIRHHLLPQLAREWNPNIVQSLAQLADLSFEEERYEPGPRPAKTELSVTALSSLRRAQARRQIRQSIAQAKGDLRGIEFHHIERVIELAAAKPGAGRLSLPGLEVTRSFDWVRFALPSPPTLLVEARNITVPGTYAAPGGPTEIRFEVDERKDGAACVNLNVLDLGRIPALLQLRGWRPGDHYHPVGQSRDQKIQEMFQRARVPSWRRRSWPIFTGGGKILWARGFGAAEEFAATGESEPVLRISEVDDVES
jgi:tRNA(Ile)-lysidine synthase